MKKVITLGPASSDGAMIERLLGVADAFRLNSSHLEPSELSLWLSKIDAVCAKAKKTVPTVVDLQGAKLRIGIFPAVDSLPSEVEVFLGSESSGVARIPTPHRELFEQTVVGETLSLNDARVGLRVVRKDSESLFCHVSRNGPLSSRKGINRAEHPIVLSELTPKDAMMVRTALQFCNTSFAFSFVLDGNEAEWLRPMCSGRKLIAKIERPEAMSNLTAIDALFDEHWLCRGDLGAQVGLRRLGSIQSDFVAQFPKLRRPKFLAGQVLEHLTLKPQPTRSEVVHLHDVERAGFDGFVLSDETAVGQCVDSVVGFLEEFYR